MPLTQVTLLAKSLLPAGIVLLTGRINLYQQPLTNEEKHLIRQAGTHRMQEFIAGRSIAKEAMQLLGAWPLSIGREENGCPIWPRQVVGSISHKGRLCGAMIGDSALYNSVGFDIEFMEPLDPDVWKTFASEEEMRQAKLCNMDEPTFANILFSAKEAHFKALYPLFKLQTPSLSNIKLAVKKLNNHVVTSSTTKGMPVHGGLISDPKALLAWALSKKTV